MKGGTGKALKGVDQPFRRAEGDNRKYTFSKFWEKESTHQTEAGEALRQNGKSGGREGGAEIETYRTRNKERSPSSLL